MHSMWRRKDDGWVISEATDSCGDGKIDKKKHTIEQLQDYFAGWQVIIYLSFL